ncbi:MAG: ankyrin repeat domain-containing protein [Chthoniobacterales bacterium]
MSFAKKQSICTTLMAGTIFLHPSSIAPEKEARTELPPSAFARAVATRNPLLFDLCLSERLDINARGEDGRTPLLVATLQDDRGAARRLLELSADVDVPGLDGRTPLMAAAVKGDMDLLRQFTTRSKAINATDADGRSAARLAMAARQYEAVDLLLSLLPEIELFPGGGRDLLMAACDSGDARMLTAVLSRLEPNLLWTSYTRRALSTALKSNDSELARLLLDKHEAAPTVEGGTVPLLAQAIATDDASTFRALIAAGADANTVLPSPVDKEFIAFLPSNYLRSYVKGDEGITVLMLAAGLGRAEYVRALLDAGANRNRQTPRYKMLALYFAARAQKAKTVQMLLGRCPSPEQLRIEISLATQRALVIKNGVPILKTSISTGRRGFETRTGEFVVTDKKRSHRSTIYHVEMPFFMRLNCLDFGMHAGAVPNYPASHGCIRLPADAAQKIFAEIPVGTVVMIN